MGIYTKSKLRIFLLLFFIGHFSVYTSAQQWGVVQKSNATQQIGNQVYYRHVVAKGNTLFSLAKVYNISVDEIKAANAGLGNELKLGEVLLIPKIEPEDVQPTASLSTDFFYHVVKQGETLTSIATIYGVSVADLLNNNSIYNGRISIGDYIKVPEKQAEPVLHKQNQQDQTSDKKSKYFEYIVKPKETLYSIAKHYGIGVETLKYINNLTDNHLSIGQVILLPRVLQDWQNQEEKTYIIHKVQPREGLYGIARKYGVSIDQIRAINPNLSTQLFIDQEIRIPRTENSKGYIEHLVSARKEKLKDIALAYDVPVRNLIDLNPGAPSKIRKGETVYIPVDFIDKKVEDLDLEVPVEDKPIPVTPEFFTENKNKVFNVALMLPLYLSEVDSMLQVSPTDLLTHRQELNPFRFIEFYEGAQIAVDSLRKTGMNLNFHVYDVTDNDVETALLLQDRSLKKMDLIISLLYSKSFALVSNFSRTNRIPLVNVLSKRGQIVYENPYVVKMSPKPEGMYQRVADFVGERFADYNTILVRNNPYQLSSEFNLLSGLLKEKINPKAPLSNQSVLQQIDYFMEGRQNTFLDTLNQELVKNDYTLRLNDIIERPFDTSWVNNNLKTVVYSRDSLAGIMRKASLFRNNLVVALGGDEVFAIELLTRLNFVRDSFSFKVIGLPDWHSFDKVDVNYSQPVSLRVLSADFVDYRSPATRKFITKFQRAYNKVPEIETYAFLGYDATFYFLHALLRYGDDMLENLPRFQIPLLENQLQFEKQNRGGYENIYWNLYRQENYNYILEK